jgi:xanthine dehydrogenase accessory factor
VIDVLIEPLDGSNTHIQQFTAFAETQTPLALATLFNGLGVGEKLLLTEHGVKQSDFQNAELVATVIPDLQKVFKSRKSQAYKYLMHGIEQEVFIELIQPSISVIIFGGGFDARPVSELAKSLGWNVSVTDECVAHIAPIFFPTADKLSLCQREFIDRDFDITPYTACVLMSHNYEYDRDVLKKLLRSTTPYIGILGPRKRFDKMLVEYKAAGITLSEADFERIHAPIGLDIGAEAPDEIALSIISEIQTKFTNRAGGFLKNINGPIHEREPGSDQVFKQVYR